MRSEPQLGRKRLYSVSAAVTCLHCGLPMFVERARVNELPAGDRLECPHCHEPMRIELVLKREE